MASTTGIVVLTTPSLPQVQYGVNHRYSGPNNTELQRLQLYRSSNIVSTTGIVVPMTPSFTLAPTDLKVYT
jgi:hypothetical protein